MKKLFINSSIGLIRKYYPDYDDVKIAEIEYGLVSLYLTMTKAIIILITALLLGIFKECIIFTIFYNLIRMPSFGLHATKSWICLVSSLIVFIGAPYLCILIKLPINVIFIFGVVGILLMCKNSPADTEKRPIINKKRRLCYKLISTVLAIIMVTTALIINNNFIANSLICVLLLQCFIISPFAYRLFGFPYDNYKKYLN